MTFRDDEVAAIKAAANHHILDLAIEFWGPPAQRLKRGSYLWRRPKRQVDTGGRYAGWFRSWSAARSGRGLDVIRDGTGLDYRGALRWAADRFGLPLDDQKPLTPEERRQAAAAREKAARERAEEARQRAAHDAADEARRIAAAQDRWEQHGRLAGCGLAYLETHRAIPTPPGGWPDELVRFVPRRDGGIVVVPAREHGGYGRLVATHEIYVDRNGRNIKEDGKGKTHSKRRTPGVLGTTQAAVRLPPRAGRSVRDPLLHAEAWENIVTAWAATGYEGVAWLGHASKARPERGRLNLILCDRDAVGSSAHQRLLEAKAAWDKDRLFTRLVFVPDDFDKDGADLNDLAQRDGIGAVRGLIRAAKLAAYGWEPTEAPAAPPEAELAEVRRAVAQAVAGFHTKLQAHLRDPDKSAPEVLIDAPAGSGKTEQAAALAGRLIIYNRAARLPYPLLVLLPNHQLIAEAAERYRGQDGLKVAILRGRGEQNCLEYPDVELTLQAGLGVRQFTCGKVNGPHCGNRVPPCGYFRQMPEVAAADVVLASHYWLTHELPPELRDRRFAAVIVDEDPSADLDGSVTIDFERHFSTELWDYPVLKEGTVDQAATTEWFDLAPRLHQALRAAAQPGGASIAQTLADAGLTPPLIERAIKLSYGRKLEGEDVMWPGMLRDKRREVAHDLKLNAELPALHVLLHALADLARAPTPATAPQLFAIMETEIDNGPLSFAGGRVTVHRLRELAAWSSRLPKLLLSATPRIETLKRVIPGLEVVTTPRPVEPHTTNILVVGGFGVGRGARREAIAKSRLVREALDFERQVLGPNAKALVVTHKACKEVFAGDPDVALLHHGAALGTDHHGDVRMAAIIGTLTPPPAAIARAASAAQGRYIAPEQMAIGQAVVALRDGSGVMIPSPGYPTNLVLQHALDAVQQAALIQEGGRPRALNRTAAHPLLRVYLGNVPPQGVVFDRIIPWQSFKLSWVERQVARHRVYWNTHDAARLHPDLFHCGSFDAAEAAMRRLGRDVFTARARAAAARLPEPWDLVRYQPAGQGHKVRYAAAPRAELEAMRAEIERELGPVTWVVVKELTAGTRPAPAGGAEESDLIKGQDPTGLSDSSATAEAPRPGSPSTTAKPTPEPRPPP